MQTEVVHDQIIRSQKLINISAGWLILLMVLSSISHLFLAEIPAYVPGVLAWMAAFILLPQISKIIALQTSFLIIVSFICLFFTIFRQGDLNIVALFNYNIGLISLLAGVSYLKLVALPQNENLSSSPKGKKAFVLTLISAHLLSSVINLSALILFAERLKHQNKLSKSAMVLLTRAFSTAAFWSPFFAAMGVALTYAPKASLFQLVAQGVPLAIMASFLTYWQVAKADTKAIEYFKGYPIGTKSLFVPLLLVVGVFVFHTLYPKIPVVLIIATLSICLTIILSFFKYVPKQVITKFNDHTSKELPKMAGELILFLSAGFLSFSVSSLLQTFNQPFPIIEFNYLFAASLLLVIILLSILGIHPVISISISGILLAPLHIEQNILGLIFLSSWALGMVISPLSGMNITVTNNYSLSFRQIILWNYRYVIVMYLITCLVLWLIMGKVN